ncbi:MAG: glycosyltransferase [Proteobacteria bacterium]|nr:glycosyltransferase [Pseudomonadota bacterium]
MIHYMSADGVGSPWVANELRGVQLAGMPFALHALRMPTKIAHEAEWARKMNDETSAIYPLSIPSLLLSLIAAPLLFRSRYLAALLNAFFGQRENLRVRIAALVHFFVAADWARRMRNQKIDLLHSQWAHSGGTVAMYGAWLLNVPFSFTGHAVDLFRQRVALRDKIKRAEFIVCISEFHRRFFLDNGAREDQLTTVYCGIDLTLFKPVDKDRPRDIFTIISAGRLIEKKGFHILIQACGKLRDQGLTFRCHIGGSGPQEAELRQMVQELSLGDIVTLTGEALMQEKIPEFMAAGDVFCLPCVWAKDDDVDGLPQLLMEAMACGLPVVSTELVGIPDLVIDQHTGLLVTAEDVDALAASLVFAMKNPDRLDAFVAEGHNHLKNRFNLDTCLEPLLDQYRKRLEAIG